MTTTRYMVSSDYFNRHDEWWFDTEEAARKKEPSCLPRWTRGGEYTGRKITCEVKYILDNPDYCKDGYVIMQIDVISISN